MAKWERYWHFFFLRKKIKHLYRLAWEDVFPSERIQLLRKSTGTDLVSSVNSSVADLFKGAIPGNCLHGRTHEQNSLWTDIRFMNKLALDYVISHPGQSFSLSLCEPISIIISIKQKLA